MAWSIVLWVAIAAASGRSSVAFGIAMPFTGAWLMLAPLVVGVAVPTPGGVGGFHEAFRLGATAFFGADNNTAVGAAIVLHAISVGPVMIVGPAVHRAGRAEAGRHGQTGGRRRRSSEVSVLRRHRRQGGRLAREPRGRRHPPPPAVPQRQVPEALHQLRAHRRDPVHGGQEGRHARALRAVEAGRRPAEGVREAADQASRHRRHRRSRRADAATSGRSTRSPAASSARS